MKIRILRIMHTRELSTKLSGWLDLEGLFLRMKPRNEAPMALKRIIHLDEIRNNLPKEQGGVGFIFHATDWETQFLSAPDAN